MRHSFRCRRRFSDWYFRFRVFLTYDFATRELLVGRAVRRGRAVRGLWLGDGHPLGGMNRTPLMIFDDGKPEKTFDDLIDSVRYGLMMLRFAATVKEHDMFRNKINYPSDKWIV